MAEHKFRCGDTARIQGTDYDIEVAYADYDQGRASWCGWPEGSVEIAKLALVSACSDDEHRLAVARWLDELRPNGNDHRRGYIERLYRPRAYWKRQRAICRQRVEEALASLQQCERELLAAQASGVEDAGPIEGDASGAVQDG